MDATTLETIKQNLLKERARLERELSQFTKKDATKQEGFETDFPSYGDKEDENAAEVATFSDNLSLEHSLASELADVTRALKRIATKHYGSCRYCGKPIDERRLLARPTSSSCIACKKELKGEET